MSGGHTVQVWLIRADQPDDVVAKLSAVLDDDERRRGDAMRTDDDRRRYRVAHGAARLIVGRALGAPPQRLRWRRGPHGKPELTGAWTGVEVNLSHSGDLNAVAVTTGRRVGVDVQELTPNLDVAAMASRYFPPAEAQLVGAAAEPAERALRFGRLWSRKEACVKACGGTLARGLMLPVAGAILVDAAVGESGAILVDAAVGESPGPFLVCDVPVPAGYCAAVALEGAAPYRVTCREWRL